jgi:protein-S-isoprenylcysteine O-methyltransferase Ste14
MNNLIVKAIGGLVFLLVVLGLALFLSAGSLEFWQAWVYLAVFGLCTLIITLYLMRFDQRLLASRVQAGPVAETQKSQQVIQGFASLFFLGLFVVAGLDYRFHWSSVPLVASLVADLVVAIGFYIVFLVFRENSFTSGTIEVKDEQKVVTTGPYAVVRHPMYAGAFLLLLFTPVALGSWVAIPFVLPLMLVIVLRLVEEEKFLTANLAGYDDYRKKVHHRIIPFLW